VILPVTETVPVDSVIPDIRFEFVAATTRIEAQEKVPEPTAIILLSLEPVPAPIETAPVTVKLFGELIDKVLAVPPLLIMKLLHTAAVFTVIVAVIPFGMTTSCAFVGTKFRDQLAAVFQLALEDPSHVFVCPNSCEKAPRVIKRKNNNDLIPG